MILKFAHNSVWATSPMCNKLPIFNLILASGILCTGLKSTKVLGLLVSLNNSSIRYRELSNTMKCPVIHGVNGAWDKNSLQLPRISEKFILRLICIWIVYAIVAFFTLVVLWIDTKPSFRHTCAYDRFFGFAVSVDTAESFCMITILCYVVR